MPSEAPALKLTSGGNLEQKIVMMDRPSDMVALLPSRKLLMREKILLGISHSYSFARIAGHYAWLNAPVMSKKKTVTVYVVGL